MQSLSSIGDYKFILPAPELRRYFSSYYFVEISTPGRVEQDDLLYPEWASARFMLEGMIPASLVPDPVVSVPRASMTGPTSRACHVRCSFARLAGIGMLPAGWSRFVGTNASHFANAVFDVETETAFSLFGAIWADIQGLQDNREIADIFDKHLLAALGPEYDREEEIERVHAALADSEITDVGQLAARVGLNSQYVERLCRRVFGFPPKRLLRRQRFLRSLGARMLDPDLKWVKVLDASYHDQAHFSRDFRDFMGMSPKAFLDMPRPISKAALRARAEALGQPLQVLHGP
ncbi:MAG: helix-turn-helix domain-containing protein [Sphingorhabdus sp.]|uniref:helix-turn-helix domain-containing protein n=1 Tax=Sphingorhabdus sp. TaxID=1902408 RepID=UPI003CB05ECD